MGRTIEDESGHSGLLAERLGTWTADGLSIRLRPTRPTEASVGLIGLVVLPALVAGFLIVAVALWYVGGPVDGAGAPVTPTQVARWVGTMGGAAALIGFCVVAIRLSWLAMRGNSHPDGILLTTHGVVGTCNGRRAWSVGWVEVSSASFVHDRLVVDAIDGSSWYVRVGDHVVDGPLARTVADLVGRLAARARGTQAEDQTANIDPRLLDLVQRRIRAR